MRSRSKSFGPRFSRELADSLRDLPLAEALRRVAFHVVKDQAFTPVKDSRTEMWIASNLQSQTEDTFELAVTGTKWFDVRAKVGGGGAIDLVMYVRGVGFAEAITLLQRSAKHDPE